MKKNITLVLLLLMGALSATAAIKITASSTSVKHQQVLVDKQEGKKVDKKVKRIQKRIEKIQQKREGEKKKIWTKLGFIIGLLALIAGVVLGIAIIANPIGGFFYFLSGLLLIVGIVLILFAAST